MPCICNRIGTCVRSDRGLVESRKEKNCCPSSVDSKAKRVQYGGVQRRKIALCVRGESSGAGPLSRPPLATGVVPVQKTHTYTGGRFCGTTPTQPICSHLLHDSHCTIGLLSSSTTPLQMQRVLSLDVLLLSVECVVVGEPLNELEKGS
jgi:hypothetical protein